MNSLVRLFTYTILLCFFCSIEVGGGLKAAFAEDVSQFLSSVPKLNDNEINLSRTLLAVSKDWDKNVDEAFFQTSIEALIEEANKRIQKNTKPTEIVTALREVIHQKFGYRYTDQLDPQGIPLNPNELFLHGLLETQKGYCMTLSLIYLIAAEHFGKPIFGVALPNHFFARYDSKDFQINIEATEGGIPLPDSFYYDRFGVGKNSSFFMKSLNKKQTLGAYFSNVGMAYYKQNLPKKAVFYLDLATQINPLSVESRNNLGNIYSELKEFKNAIEQYKAATQADPNNLATLFNLGIAYSDSGEKKEASEAFMQVIQIDPNYVPAHRYLIQIFINQRNFIGALLHLKQIANKQRDNPEISLTIAEVYFQLKNYEMALQTLKKIESDFPDNPKFKEKLAEAFYRMEKFDEAISQYRYLIELIPNDLRSYVQLGWTYYRKGEIDLAIGWTKRGLKDSPEPDKLKTLGRMNLGFFNVLDRQFEEAKNWYKKALSASDSNLLKGMVGDLTEAQGKFPNLMEIYFFKGWLYKESKNDKKAAEFLQKYLAKAPNGKMTEAAKIALTELGITVNTDDLSNELEEGMILIPSGFFLMGSDDNGSEERPKHKVFLDSYFIDQFETSAEEFANFLNESPNPSIYYKDNKYGVLGFGKKFKPKKGYESFPINNVTWFGAKEFCQFNGKRLPTEAEWEKAARGIDGRKYPWGDTKPTPTIARFNQQWDEKKLNAMVSRDSMSGGKSPFGLGQMAGNIKEWVDDWYDGEYYTENKHKINPKGPFGGEFKVLKGGSWHDLASYLYSSFRNNSAPSMGLEDYGFRCAKSKEKGQTPKKLIGWQNN
jgi:formylglycine-generating enzyme required for sulfatase activity/regulator of sirC expression with transglutaminase-like and TPR domain